MQRLAITLSSIALVFVMLVNAALFYQNLQLRSRTVAPVPQPTQATITADQSAKLAELEQQLKRADQDRVKATRDAATARAQFDQLRAAANERDTLKSQVQTLNQENAQLRAQVGNLQTMNTINGQVAPLRGLTPTSQVPRTFLNHDQLRAYFTNMLDKEWPAEQEQRQAAIMRAFEIGGSGANLRQTEIDSMVSNVLGFYDHDSKQLVVVTDRAQMGVRDRVTYAHEFTHSLQDQHYDLTALLARANGNSDYALALRALVEGDATLTMGMYASQNLTAMDVANMQLEEFQSLDLSSMSFGGPLGESTTYFPYREGANFVSLVYRAGGWRAVNEMFKNPPRSSEQILHPERYYAGDMPADLALPEPQIKGWQVLATDTVGEFGLRVYLERFLPNADAIAACEGWGGDRFQVLGDTQGRVALAIQTAWDSPEEARQFFEAMNGFVAGLSGGSPATLEADGAHMRWQVANRQFYLGIAGNRVQVLHAPDAATLDALIARL